MPPAEARELSNKAGSWVGKEIWTFEGDHFEGYRREAGKTNPARQVELLKEWC